MFDLTRRRLLTKTSVAVKSGKRYEAVHQSLTAPGYSRVLRVLFPIRCCDLSSVCGTRFLSQIAFGWLAGCIAAVR